MLKISKLAWRYKEFNHPQDIALIMNKKFKELNIQTKGEILQDEDGKFITFTHDTKKTFASAINNKINLTPNDPRKKRIGRDHLLSKRPTKEQYEGFFNAIQSTLNDVGLFAKVELIIPKTNQTILLRNGLEIYNNYPVMKSYPIKKENE